MSISASEVLETFDRHINNDPQTGLTPMMFQLWTHFFPADTRLTVFRSDDNWAVFIEIVCFRPGQEDSSLETWCYSNCLSEPALLWYDAPYQFCLAAGENAEDEEDSSYPQTPFQFCIVWGEERLEFSPAPEDYAALGIVVAPDIKEQGNHVGGHILRFLCEQLNHPFFNLEADLRQLLEENWRENETPRTGDMVLLWQTQHWRHPAIVGTDREEERPRALPYFQALARAMESGSAAEMQQQDPATFNTDWRIWDQEERDQEETSRAGRAALEDAFDAVFDQLPPEMQEYMRDRRGSIFIQARGQEDLEQDGDALSRDDQP